MAFFRTGSNSASIFNTSVVDVQIAENATSKTITLTEDIPYGIMEILYTGYNQAVTPPGSTPTVTSGTITKLPADVSNVTFATYRTIAMARYELKNIPSGATISITGLTQNSGGIVSITK